MFGLTLPELITIVAAVLAAIGIVAALATAPGRAAFATFGLRIVDALTRWLEHKLDAEVLATRQARQLRDLKRP